MDFVSKKLKKKYNITSIEAAYTWADSINGWEFLPMHSSARYAHYVTNM